MRIRRLTALADREGCAGEENKATLCMFVAMTTHMRGGSTSKPNVCARTFFRVFTGRSTAIAVIKSGLQIRGDYWVQNSAAQIVVAQDANVCLASGVHASAEVKIHQASVLACTH